MTSQVRRTKSSGRVTRVYVRVGMYVCTCTSVCAVRMCTCVGVGSDRDEVTEVSLTGMGYNDVMHENTKKRRTYREEERGCRTMRRAPVTEPGKTHLDIVGIGELIYMDHVSSVIYRQLTYLLIHLHMLYGPWLVDPGQ